MTQGSEKMKKKDSWKLQDRKFGFSKRAERPFAFLRVVPGYRLTCVENLTCHATGKVISLFSVASYDRNVFATSLQIVEAVINVPPPGCLALHSKMLGAIVPRDKTQQMAQNEVFLSARRAQDISQAIQGHSISYQGRKVKWELKVSEANEGKRLATERI